MPRRVARRANSPRESGIEPRAGHIHECARATEQALQGCGQKKSHEDFVVLRLCELLALPHALDACAPLVLAYPHRTLPEGTGKGKGECEGGGNGNNHMRVCGSMLRLWNACVCAAHTYVYA